jgi:hypothetical protein
LFAGVIWIAFAKISRLTFTKNFLLLQGRSGARCRNLNQGFTADAHKYYFLFIAGVIWISFAGILRPSFTKILLLLQGRFGARLPESGPIVFTADAHKYSPFVAGAIWSAFAEFDLGLPADAHKTILLLLEG